MIVCGVKAQNKYWRKSRTPTRSTGYFIYQATMIHLTKANVATNATRQIRCAEYKRNKEITRRWNVAIILAQTKSKCTLFLMSYIILSCNAQFGGFLHSKMITQMFSDHPFSFLPPLSSKFCIVTSGEKMFNLDHLSIQLIAKTFFFKMYNAFFYFTYYNEKVQKTKSGPDNLNRKAFS